MAQTGFSMDRTFRTKARNFQARVNVQGFKATVPGCPATFDAVGYAQLGTDNAGKTVKVSAPRVQLGEQSTGQTVGEMDCAVLADCIRADAGLLPSIPEDMQAEPVPAVVTVAATVVEPVKPVNRVSRRKPSEPATVAEPALNGATH